jgi:hypothetical protein
MPPQGITPHQRRASTPMRTIPCSHWAWAISALPIRTGEQRWVSHAMPQAGEFALDTWAEGMQWRSHETVIPSGDMGGVRDLPSNGRFMQPLGCSAAPANAHASVKQLARYTSPYEDAREYVEILARLPRR